MEYENNASLEAKVVKDFDKIEMILQALEYEKGEVILTFEYLHYHFPMCSSYEVWACDQTKWIIDKIQLMYQLLFFCIICA